MPSPDIFHFEEIRLHYWNPDRNVPGPDKPWRNCIFEISGRFDAISDQISDAIYSGHIKKLRTPEA